MQKCYSRPSCHSRPFLSFPRRRESRGGNSNRNPRSGRIYATKTGVTLLEMIVVMAIIVIITAASLPSFLKFINTSRLRGSARDITTALRTGRRLAITTRITRKVTVYLNNYTIDSSIKNSVSFYETPDSIELKRAAANIRFEEDVSTDADHLEFSFSPRGTTSSNTIRVIDPDDKYIDIKVLGTTGRVRMEDIHE